jgi:hypothetical protein
VAPLVFQHDPDGTSHSLAVQLRNYEMASYFEAEDSAPIFEPVDGEETDLDETRTPAAKTERRLTPATARTGAPRVSRAMQEPLPEIVAARKFEKQKEIISAWIDDENHEATEECRHALELYVQLNDSEFSYVTADLRLIQYDEARCFFLQWVLGKETKELANSARISAV